MQWGSRSLCAIISLHEAIFNPPAMIVIVSPSMQQSVELYKKISDYHQKIPGAPAANLQSLTRIQLRNGSRIISLPGSEKTVRGYSGATLIVVDEASRVEDEMLAAIRPMMATTQADFSRYQLHRANAAGGTRLLSEATVMNALLLRAASARGYLLRF